MDAWISSRVLPLVSGTSRSTNKTVSPLMLANMKNVPAVNPRYERKTSATLQRIEMCITHRCTARSIFCVANMLTIGAPHQEEIEGIRDDPRAEPVH
jgi:hypothetical protein